MLGQRRRRWSSVVPTLGERLMFAGMYQKYIIACIMFFWMYAYKQYVKKTLQYDHSH